MSEMKIVKTIYIKAPREHVWKFLTEADRLALWFHRGDADLNEGSDYKLLSNSYGKDGQTLIEGKVLEFKKPERLVHSFTHGGLQDVETICTWTLQEADGGTVLVLEHTGFEKLKEGAFGMAADHDKGWDAHLTRLRLVAG